MLKDNRDDPTFFIKSNSAEFGNRQKNIFDLLNLAEQGSTLSQNQSPPDVPEIDSQSRRKRRHETKPFKGKESLFKRPEDVPPKFKNFKRQSVPDFQKNPHKWTKYSLADVSSDDLSEKTNTSTALAFINKLRHDKIEQHPENFKSSVSELNDTTDEKVVFKGSKVVMPEYIVGQKKEKPAKRLKKEEKGSRKEIKLDHLQDYEDN